MERKKRIEMIFCLIVLWAAAIAQGYALTKESGEEKSVEAFQTLQLSSVEGSVEVSAPVNKLYLNQSEKKQVLLDLVKELGITTGFSMTDETTEERERMELSWTGKEEQFNISITTMNLPMGDGNFKQNQYIYMICDVKENTEKLLSYHTLMKKMMKRRGLEPVTNLNLTGRQNGNLTSRERQQITDRLFHSLKAVEVESVKEEELYTVYGYSNLLKDSIAYGENEINLNLAFTYDEEEKQTVFYLSMPYIRTDY